MILPTRRTTAVLVAAAGVLTACGSSADESTSSGVVTDIQATEPTDPTPSTTPATPPPPPSTEEGGTTTTTDAAPTTTDAPSTSSIVDVAPAVGCRRLTDFDADLGEWLIVNDGVMGGRSAGFVEVDDSLMRFDGTIVTEGGGFTSVRRRLDGDELVDTSRVEIRFRPDERRYAVILESDERIDGRSVSYRAELDTSGTDDDGFATMSVSYSDLDTSIFGFRVDAAPFDPDEGREIGLIISDGIDGDFTLDVDWIDVCR